MRRDVFAQHLRSRVAGPSRDRAVNDPFTELSRPRPRTVLSTGRTACIEFDLSRKARTNEKSKRRSLRGCKDQM